MDFQYEIQYIDFTNRLGKPFNLKISYLKIKFHLRVRKGKGNEVTEPIHQSVCFVVFDFHSVTKFHTNNCPVGCSNEFPALPITIHWGLGK